MFYYRSISYAVDCIKTESVEMIFVYLLEGCGIPE